MTLSVVRRLGSCAALALAALCGCQSYEIVQRNIFVNESGDLVSVDYGRSESNHVNTFVSPVTGKEMEFKSRLVVRVELPDGGRETAWQCMNFTSRGTMYKTDDEEWMFLVSGFSFIVYHQTEGDESRYLEVFRGVLCDTPEREVKKRDDEWKWQDVLPDGRNRKDPKKFKK